MKMKRNRKLLRAVVSAVVMVSMIELTLPANVIVSKASTNNKVECIVTLDESEGESFLKKYDKFITDEYGTDTANVVSMNIPREDMNALKKQDGVAAVEKEITLEGLASEEDITGLSELFEDAGITEEDCNLKSEQWYLDAIGITDQVKEAAQKDSDIKIELLDSGVSYSEDIETVQNINLIPGEEEMNSWYEDVSGHGTAAAGIIGAADNETGITGINPNANIYSVKILDEQNKSTLSRTIEGIYWGIAHNMNIINMSFGTSVNSPALHQAVRDAYDAGILLVAAAGNSGSESVMYPAAYPEVIAVGATGTNGEQMQEYASGSELELFAPGEGILTSGLFDGVLTTAGTSFSAAQVTAAASILWTMDSSQPADFIRKLMSSSGKLLKTQEDSNRRLIDVGKAVEYFDEYALEYESEDGDLDAITDPGVSEEFEDILVVDGLWTSDKHASIIKDYLNSEGVIGATAYAKLGNDSAGHSNRVNIMAATAREADHNFKTKGSTLHGTGNYRAGLRYLYDCAQNVRSGKSNSAANAAACKGLVDRVEDKDKTALNNLAGDTLRMLDTKMPSISSDQTTDAVRYFKVMGFALHCIQDTFAHRAIVQKSEADNSKFFITSNFKNWPTFYQAVQRGEVEYRDIVQYTNGIMDESKSRGRYEDNPAVGNTRFKDARRQSAYLLRESLLKMGYRATWVTKPDYGTVLMGAATYSD